MEDVTNLTNVSLPLWQFIALCSFLIANTSAIIAAWYRYGYRISNVERDNKEMAESLKKIQSDYINRTAQEELAKRIIKIEDSYITKETYINHIDASACAFRDFTDMLKDVKSMISSLQSKVDVHLAIHSEREKK